MHLPIPAAEDCERYRDDLVKAGLFIPSEVPGVYGLSGVFEDVVERFERYLTRAGAVTRPEVMRFPPVLSRPAYEKTDHIETFPQLMGSVHRFTGDEDAAARLAEKKTAGLKWAADLVPSDLMMLPAACYPLYPACAGVLPAVGRTVDLRAFVFRQEPSNDPARLRMFRQREYVRLGTPEQALAHRDWWLSLAAELLRELAIDVDAVVASDPFFGRSRRIMAASQREQTLKYELVSPIASIDHRTAVASCNYHLDHFGRAFDIRTPDGAFAHSACVGFGLERVALALFKAHGLDPAAWPDGVRRHLD
jgi:seryl-tRNA synthetase